MDGVLFAGDAVGAVHTVPQPLTQRISKKPGESGLPAGQGQSNSHFFNTQDQIPTEENTQVLQVPILSYNTPSSEGLRARENHLS